MNFNHALDKVGHNELQARFWNHTWVQALALPVMSCVCPLPMSISSSVTCSICLIGLLRGLNWIEMTMLHVVVVHSKFTHTAIGDLRKELKRQSQE